MISGERILNQADQLRLRQQADSKKSFAEMAKWSNEAREKMKAEEEAFTKVEDELRQKAIGEHEARFRPLQEILDHFKEPFSILRDQYFPRGRIVVADGYNFLYKKDTPNIYHRSLVLFEPDYKYAFILDAVAEETNRRKYLLFGPNLGPDFSVVVRKTTTTPQYINQEWRPLIGRAKRKKEDFQQIMKQEEIFTRYFDGPFFASRFSTNTGSLHYIPNSRIPFDWSKKAFNSIANELAKHLSYYTIPD